METAIWILSGALLVAGIVILIQFAIIHDAKKDEERLKSEHAASAKWDREHSERLTNHIDGLERTIELFFDLVPALKKNFAVFDEKDGEYLGVNSNKVADFIAQQELSDKFNDYITVKRDIIRGVEETND